MRGDAFEVHSYADADAARAAIREREVYGAVVPAEGRVLVASAASPAVAQQLDGDWRRPARKAEDVVPVAPGDPRGAALNLLFLPLMIACFPLAILLGRMRLPRRRLLGAVLGFSALSGLALTALLRAMDALPGPYLAVSGVAALVVAAVGLTATGLVRAARAGRPRDRRGAVRRARQPGLGQRAPPRSCCPASGASPASCSRPARAARRCATSRTSTATRCSCRRSCSPPGRSLGAALILIGRRGAPAAGRRRPAPAEPAIAVPA